jgi:hypothetical protein
MTNKSSDLSGNARASRFGAVIFANSIGQVSHA